MEDCDIIELYWQRDQGSIQATADKYGIVMAFTGMRVFHH